MEKQKTIYQLELHESIIVAGSGFETEWRITRVAGGWLYQDYNPRIDIPITYFVPFNNEFQNSRPN